MNVGAEIGEDRGGRVGQSSNTFTIPLFSATNTRPSGEKRIAVGRVRPLNTTSSTNPGGSVDAASTDAGFQSIGLIAKTRTDRAQARRVNAFIGTPTLVLCPSQRGYRPLSRRANARLDAIRPELAGG